MAGGSGWRATILGRIRASVSPAGNLDLRSSGLTGADFLRGIITEVPAESTIEFDELEPPRWRDALGDWRIGTRYALTRLCRQQLDRLLSGDAGALQQCPHISIADRAGNVLMASLDHFGVVWVDPSLREKMP